MGKLVYVFNASLDGYIADRDGDFSAFDPDDDIFAFHLEQMRGIAVEVYGRRLWETMHVWETYGDQPEASPAEHEFGEIWKATRKYVVSRTLTETGGDAELLTGDLAEELTRLKAGEGDVAIGGAGLAASAIELGLVDEYGVVTYPVVLGGGTPYLPELAEPIGLELLESRLFDSGAVYTRYAATR